MSAPALLTDAERAALAERLPDWTVDDGKLCRTFTFDDFIAAFGFMAKVAVLAERAQHHPDWRNVWNRVEVALVTHDAGGLTARDVDLAREIDAVV